MIYTVNKSQHPYDGMNVHLRALEKLKLTRHKLGYDPQDEDLKHADLVILGNFLPQEVYQIRANMNPRVKLGYLFCSPFGQAGCNGELALLSDMVSLLDMTPSLDYLFFANRQMMDTIGHSKGRYLPSVSDFEGTFCPVAARDGVLLIGNNLRTSRNFPTQLAGIKLAQELGLTTPINSIGMDKEPFEFFKRLYKIKNWYNEEKHITEKEKVERIASSRVGMQITYSDAFNISAYEHAMCHVPCLISHSLRWGVPDVKVKSIDDPMAIAKHLLRAAETWNYQTYEGICQRFHNSGKDAMKINFEECDKTLRGCL